MQELQFDFTCLDLMRLLKLCYNTEQRTVLFQVNIAGLRKVLLLRH